MWSVWRRRKLPSMQRMMCSREPPWLLGLLLIGRANFVARIICSRRPLSQRPIYSSVRPIVSGVEPRGYALAVSKKKTPLSNALSIIAREVGSSHWFPKVIVPRQIFETCSPVRPRYVTFILSSPDMYDAEGDDNHCFKLSNDLWYHAGHTKSVSRVRVWAPPHGLPDRVPKPRQGARREAGPLGPRFFQLLFNRM